MTATWVASIGLCLLGLSGAFAGRQVPPTQSRLAAEVDELRSWHESGDYQRVTARARALLEQLEQQKAPTLEIAAVVDILAEALSMTDGARDEALRLAEQSLKLREASAGPDDRRTAYSLFNLGAILVRRAEFARAHTTLERARGIYEASPVPQDEMYARTLGALGTLAQATGDLKRSRDLLERGLRLLEAALGPEHVRVAQAMVSLGATLERMGESEQAKAFDARALAIYRKHYTGDHPAVAQLLSNQAWDADRAGEFERSHSLHRESVAMYERTLGRDSVDLAWELNNYGLLFWRTADYASARPTLERALDIWTRAQSPDASKALNNLAVTARRLGDLVGARRYYERSLAIKEKTYGPNHPEVALVLFNLGNLLTEVGDYPTAHALYDRALRIREDRLGKNHSLTAYVLNSLARVLVEQREYTHAQALSERAVGIWRGLGVPDIAVGLSTLASISYERSELAAALAYYDEARSVYEQLYGKDHPDVGAVINNTGNVLAAGGDYRSAADRFRQALAIFERMSPTHPSIAQAASGLAGAQLALGNHGEALALALRAERISREHFRLTSRTLSEREALAFMDTRAPAMAVLVTLAANPDLSLDERREIADAVIRSRALVLDEMADRTVRRRNADSATVSMLDALSRARQRVANLLVRSGGNNHQRLLAAAIAERDAAERQLAETSAEFREQRLRETAGVDDVSRAIPEGAALVAFLRYDHVSRRPAARGSRTRQDADNDYRYAAFVLRAGSRDVTFLPLGSAAAIETAVARWRTAISAPPADGGEAVYRRTAATLTRVAWEPVRAQLSSVDTVLIVPDGALNLVSFAALPLERNQYLIDHGPLVHYLSAERDLVARSIPAGAAARRLLAVGDPAYDGESKRQVRVAPAAAASTGAPATAGTRGATSGCPELRQIKFNRLPATSREIADVAELWRGGDANALAQQLTGALATEAAFKREAANNHILHLATHGFFLGECGPASSNARGVGGVVARQPHPPQPAANPLLLSGLALAGANTRSARSVGEEDGILTAEEVASLDLRGVEWVVLSACDTGLGEIRAGEGVLGLRRAFAIAGARTTIMSLWAVEDRSTREWMAVLYRARLLEGRSTAEAVRDAGRQVLQQRRARRLNTHPFFWAGFVAAGDWR